jgi:hypothetical protein
MRVGRKLLQVAWDRARDDAGLERSECAIFLVKARMPLGRAEAGYYRPGGPDVPHDLLIPSILRHVSPRMLERYENRHRVAIWSHIPGAPYALLGPLLRHELEHAAQWQRHGRSYSDLDGYLREAWDARSDPKRYLRLPSEREANLAAAFYATAQLADSQLRRLKRIRRYRQLVNGGAELESDSLSLTVAALRDAGTRFLPKCEPDEREKRLRSLEQSALNWRWGVLSEFSDSNSDDVVVMAHPDKGRRDSHAEHD